MENELGFILRDCEHGGVWMARPDGEGMQVTGERLEHLKAMLEAFWATFF